MLEHRCREPHSPPGSHPGMPTPAPRYDEHADWYDVWTRTGGVPFMAGVTATLLELVPEGSGPALDIGCGTGPHADTVRSLGWSPLGTDVSSGQLRHAAARLPVVRADGRALPVADGSVRLTLSVCTSTDVPDYGHLVAEAVRVLAPGGCFVHVGVHPCFVSPYAERLADGACPRPGDPRGGGPGGPPFAGH